MRDNLGPGLLGTFSQSRKKTIKGKRFAFDARLTNVEESIKVVILGFAYAGLLKQPQDGGVSKDRFVNLRNRTRLTKGSS